MNNTVKQATTSKISKGFLVTEVHMGTRMPLRAKSEAIARKAEVAAGAKTDSVHAWVDIFPGDIAAPLKLANTEWSALRALLQNPPFVPFGSSLGGKKHIIMIPDYLLKITPAYSKQRAVADKALEAYVTALPGMITASQKDLAALNVQVAYPSEADIRKAYWAPPLKEMVKTIDEPTARSSLTIPDTVAASVVDDFISSNNELEDNVKLMKQGIKDRLIAACIAMQERITDMQKDEGTKRITGALTNNILNEGIAMDSTNFSGNENLAKLSAALKTHALKFGGDSIRATDQGAAIANKLCGQVVTACNNIDWDV